MSKKFVLVLIFLVICVGMLVTPVMATSTKVTALTIKAPSSVTTEQQFDISGKLTGGPTGVGVSDKQITVYKSTNGKMWTAIGTTWTDSGGYYTLTTSESVSGKYLYRSSFSGDKIFMKVTSQITTVSNLIQTRIGMGVVQNGLISLALIYDNPTTNGVNGEKIYFYSSSDGGTSWSLDDTCITSNNAYGEAGYCYIDYDPGSPAGTQFKAVFNGDAIYAPTSKILTL